MNQRKPTEISSLMEVGLAAVAQRMASKLCLMSEAWVSTGLLYNSTPIGSERKRQLNPLLGGGGWGGVVQRGKMRIHDPEEACMGGKKKKKDVHGACGEEKAVKCGPEQM